jgi:hypothetical protein
MKTTRTTWGLNPAMSRRRIHRRAKVARFAFSLDAPPDAPALPLSYAERENLKSGGLPHLVAWFARSIEAGNYQWWVHPLFADFASGVLASPFAPDFIKRDEQLRGRFAPRPLNGLGPGLIWSADYGGGS